MQQRLPQAGEVNFNILPPFSQSVFLRMGEGLGMRENNPIGTHNMKKIIWTIAGSDSSSGAGISTDIQTANALGVHACGITTAVTAQNQQTISHTTFTDPHELKNQIDTLAEQYPPAAIKIGMIGTKELISVIANFLQHYNGYVVLDPVFYSSSGIPLFAGNLSEYISQFKILFPHVDLLTPNIHEAEILINSTFNDESGIISATKKILAMNIRNVLLKGGHRQNIFAQDYWTNGTEDFWLASPRQPFTNIRGTGCTLASAIAATIAQGYEIKDALVIAKMYLNQGIRHSYALNNAHHISHTTWPENQIDLPFLSHQPLTNITKPFPPCNTTPLGLYPIIDDVSWLKKLLPLGISTFQLRIKDKPLAVIEEQIKESIQLAKHYAARLFINDYWELAIKHNAYGIHLGQEDILTADVNAIRNAGIRLGVSTHCYYEVARAHTLQPSYLACGPIYPTTSKIMPFLPQGLENLKRWRRTLQYPLVAIGGISLERLPAVVNAHVDGVAMISAITHAQDPLFSVKEMIKIITKKALTPANV